MYPGNRVGLPVQSERALRQERTGSDWSRSARPGIVAYAHAGKMDEAKAALAEARSLNPAITVKWMIEHTANFPAVFDGLRKGCLP